MRVGLVCPYSLTLPGGVQGQVLGLGRALRSLGVDARILAPCDGPPPDPAVTPLGNSVPAASNGSMAAIAPDPAASLRTIRALRDEQFDVVNVHEPLAPGPTLTAMVFENSPLVGTFHRAGQSGWVRTFRPLGVWAVSHLDLRVAVSEEARATAIEAVGGEYDLVWNGIDIDAYCQADAWPTDGPTIMFIGRHEPRKGLAVLLQAFRLLDGDTRLWIASHGPETETLERETAGEERIEWLGMITEAEKVKRMRGADVLCAPSLHGESFGVILLEGMAAGTPVVASDIPGYRAVAAKGQAAMLTPPGDPAALAANLGRALDGGPAVSAMVEAGRAQVARFSMASLAERYIDLYESAIATAADKVRRPSPRIARFMGRSLHR